MRGETDFLLVPEPDLISAVATHFLSSAALAARAFLSAVRYAFLGVVAVVVDVGGGG
jgi:hypothetical protein